MAAPEQLASTFPAPPAYYKLFLENQPAPLEPPKPPQGQFQVYDKLFSLEEPLVGTSANSMIQAGPDGNIDIKAQLLSLTDEVPLLFLEVLRSLTTRSTAHAAQLSRLQMALNAMQHLTNMLRPPQALATMEYALQLEVAEKREALERLRAQVDSLDKLLLRSGQELVDAASSEAAAVEAAAQAGTEAATGAQGQHDNPTEMQVG